MFWAEICLKYEYFQVVLSVGFAIITLILKIFPLSKSF